MAAEVKLELFLVSECPDAKFALPGKGDVLLLSLGWRQVWSQQQFSNVFFFSKSNYYTVEVDCLHFAGFFAWNPSKSLQSKGGTKKFWRLENEFHSFEK